MRQGSGETCMHAQKFLNMPVRVCGTYFPLGGLFPRPPPDGFGVWLGVFFRVVMMIFISVSFRVD